VTKKLVSIGLVSVTLLLIIYTNDLWTRYPGGLWIPLIFYTVDTQASIIGGLNKLYSELGTINIPKDPEIDQIKIFISFIVESNGDITELRTTNKIKSATLDNELLQLFRKYKWEPGICKGEKVPTKLVLVVKS
jgi:hypothetical protein